MTFHHDLRQCSRHHSRWAVVEAWLGRRFQPPTRRPRCLQRRYRNARWIHGRPESQLHQRPLAWRHRTHRNTSDAKSYGNVYQDHLDWHHWTSDRLCNNLQNLTRQFHHDGVKSKSDWCIYVFVTALIRIVYTMVFASILYYIRFDVSPLSFPCFQTNLKCVLIIYRSLFYWQRSKYTSLLRSNKQRICFYKYFFSF